VVATTAEELRTLDVLLEQARQNGVPGMHFVSREEMLLREPNLTPRTTGALWAPTGGICDPFNVTVAAAENAVQNGVTVMTETVFEDFLIENGRIRAVHTDQGAFLCRWAINAAGLFADAVMHAAGVRPEFHITPRRGEYAVLDRAEITINNVLFPAPSSKGKGILVTTTVHGNTIIGPNADLIDDKDDRAMTAGGLKEVWEGAHKLIPALNPRFVIGLFAGNRATGNAPCQMPGVSYNADFIIEVAKEVQGLINLGGIESPGLTSAPAIAQRVVELLRDAGEKLEAKRSWNPIRPPRPRFRELPREEQMKLVRTDPRYGRVVCRCELVTEGEIIAELRSPLPPRTYDALKRRTWLGTGRCQGSFDMPRVVAIMARELGVSPYAITKSGAGSEFLVRATKNVEAPDAA
jgi:glycerol-3-phosphate dehydrogenase